MQIVSIKIKFNKQTSEMEYSAISTKRKPLVQRKCPLYRDVRVIEIFLR